MVSAKQVLARVIRALGYKLPSTYHDDILEWIAEGIGMTMVTNNLVTRSTGNLNCPGEVLIKNHCAPLPCGFISVKAVEDEQGRDLPEGGDITDITSPTSIRHSTDNEARASVFEVNPFQHQTEDGLPVDEPGTSIPIFGQDLVPQTTTEKQRQYYKIEGNYIQTSFEEGYIKIHYNALPVCSEGYPLIPDSENLKQALEWHVIRRLIGSGYEHKVFNYVFADNEFEKYANRAMNEISYPSIDSMERIKNSTVKLIPPTNYAEDFFVNSETPEILRK